MKVKKIRRITKLNRYKVIFYIEKDLNYESNKYETHENKKIKKAVENEIIVIWAENKMEAIFKFNDKVKKILEIESYIKVQYFEDDIKETFFGKNEKTIENHIERLFQYILDNTTKSDLFPTVFKQTNYDIESILGMGSSTIQEALKLLEAFSFIRRDTYQESATKQNREIYINDEKPENMIFDYELYKKAKSLYKEEIVILNKVGPRQL